VDLECGVCQDIDLVVMLGVWEGDEFGVPFVSPRLLREPDLALFAIRLNQAFGDGQPSA
jgi:hypothetical protein